MMVLIAGSISLLTRCGDEEKAVLYLSEVSAETHAKINCKVPLYAKGYPCFMGDGTPEVQALLDKVKNYLLIDPDCRGILLAFGDDARDVSHNKSGSKFYVLEIQIPFGDEKNPSVWLLSAPNEPIAKTIAGHGYDQPQDMAHIVCGIVARKGAQRVK
jgi:hypothetical protein